MRLGSNVRISRTNQTSSSLVAMPDEEVANSGSSRSVFMEHAPRPMPWKSSRAAYIHLTIGTWALGEKLNGPPA